MNTVKIYQSVVICFKGETIRTYYGALSAQSDGGSLMHIFDGDVLLVSVNTNNINWIEWVQ